MKKIQIRSTRRWALGLLFSSLTVAAFAHAGVASIGSGTLGFEATGDAGLKISGHGGPVTASEAGGNIAVKVPVGTLKTGLSLRDTHLKKAINAGKHGTATMTVPRSSLKFPENNKTVTSSANGKLTFNGQTKSQKFNYSVKRTGSDYHVQGLMDIDITKYGVEQPCYLGVCVDTKVKVKVKFKVREK